MSILRNPRTHSGLAVQPNPDHEGGASAGGLLGAIRARAVAAPSSSTNSGGDQIQRRITMYRSGFVVDDGPYRLLSDPSNGEFLRSLAAGRTPAEMSLDEHGEPMEGEVVVGLVDKRGEEYDPANHSGGSGASAGGGGGGGGGGGFAAFDGEGTSLGSAATPATSGGVIAPDSDATPPTLDSSQPTTSLQIRLLDGTRLVIKVNTTATVGDVAATINASGQAGSDMYVLSAGFPPRPIEDLSKTVQEAGLAGSVVNQKKA